MDALRRIGRADDIQRAHLIYEGGHFLVPVPHADEAIQVRSSRDAPDPVGGIDEGAFQQTATDGIQNLARADKAIALHRVDDKFAAPSLGHAIAEPDEHILIIAVAGRPMGPHLACDLALGGGDGRASQEPAAC